MRTRLYLALFGIMLLATVPSCYIVNFSKDVEFNLTYQVSGNELSITQTFLLDAAEYSSIFDQYKDNINSITINSITCYLTHFNGPADQTISDGLLTVDDENGSGSQQLATMPTKALQELLGTEQNLILDPAGIDRVEELILHSPNKCSSTFSGTINSAPVDFTVVFHIMATMTGSLL